MFLPLVQRLHGAARTVPYCAGRNAARFAEHLGGTGGGPTKVGVLLKLYFHAVRGLELPCVELDCSGWSKNLVSLGILISLRVAIVCVTTVQPQA